MNHLSQQRRRDDLGLFVQINIFDIHQFFQDLSSGSTGADTASLDLFSEFFILDQLSGILHSKDHGAGIVAFRRRCLSLFDLVTFHRQLTAFFQSLKQSCIQLRFILFIL